MVSKRALTSWMAVLAVWAGAPLRGATAFQVEGEGVSGDEPAASKPPQSDHQQFENMLQQAKNMGPWDREAQVQDQAAGLFFERQGWTSEPDQFALNTMRDVGRVPPWQFKQRMDVFMNALQNRYSLSESQKADLNRQFQQESMRLTMAHFQTVAPIAMDALKTRAAGKPFTPEQVARWMKTLRPIMDDGRRAMERIGENIAESMTPDQRKKLDVDMKALVRRHEDVVRAVNRWQTGDWDPTQWGLDNDPVHAAAVAEVRVRKMQLQAAQQSAIPGATPAPARPDDETTWERYVREFCAAHGFDAKQKKSAKGILDDQTARAANFRRSRAKQIAALQTTIAAEKDAARKSERTKELQAELAPIAEMFEELKGRLDELMTAEQRQLSAPEKPVRAAQRPSE